MFDSKRLKELMEKEGYSARRLALETRISQVAIAAYMRGKSEPSLDYLCDRTDQFDASDIEKYRSSLMKYPIDKEPAGQNNKENPQSVSDKESRKTDTAFAQDMLMGVGITAIFAFIAFSVIMWVGRFAKNAELMMDGMTGAYIALIAVIIIMAVSIRLDKVISNKDDKIRQFSAGKCVNRQTDNRNKEKRS